MKKLENYLDLHMHTSYSLDGEYSPEKLVELCGAVGVRIMSISDHNSAKANKAAALEAKRAGIVYINGIELDCRFKNADLHVLGYGIDDGTVDFERFERAFKEQHVQVSKKSLEFVRSLGFKIEAQELREHAGEDKDIWTGELFAEVLLAKPQYNDSEILLPYRSGGARADNPYVNFFWDWFSQGKPGYVGVELPALVEITDAIHKNGGKAVLAHPGKSLEGQFGLLDEMVGLGLDGIEAESSYHSAQTTDYFFKKAKELGLFVTGGSDFHGKTKPSIALGTYGRAMSDSAVEAQLREEKIIQ